MKKKSAFIVATRREKLRCVSGGADKNLVCAHEGLEPKTANFDNKGEV